MSKNAENLPAEKTANRPPAIAAPRLPYHPAVQERFGIGLTEWRALVDAVFPLAKEPESVIMALAYCKARKLDPFKKPVHIVPMWNGQLKRMVETVWPGIGELRTTAFRTGQYAGRDPSEFGPTVEQKVGKTAVSYPEWCQITVYRNLDGQRVPFPGPRVYWLESYATAGRDDPSPNSMWARRPFGQLEKCAEAAALRSAFPEEVGNEYTAEEMEGRVLDTLPAAKVIEAAPATSLSGRMAALATKPAPKHDPETGEIHHEQNRASSEAATGAEEFSGPSGDASAPESGNDEPSEAEIAEAASRGREAALEGYSVRAMPREYKDRPALKQAWLESHEKTSAEADAGGEG